MPAKASIQNYMKTHDSRLRGNDAKGRLFYFLRKHQAFQQILAMRLSRLLLAVSGK